MSHRKMISLCPSKTTDAFFRLRQQSSWVNRRMELVPFTGGDSNVQMGKGILLSEEFPLFVAPILSLANSHQVRDVIFIERGAYPFKCALDLLQQHCPRLPRMNTYAYKIVSGNSPKTANHDLADAAKSFIPHYFPDEAAKMPTKELLALLPGQPTQWAGKTALEVVCAVVQTEPSTYIDDVKVVNRLFKKMCHSKITPDEFRAEIQKIKSDCAQSLLPILDKFPDVTTVKTRPYLTAIMLHMNRFLVAQYSSHKFIHTTIYEQAFQIIGLPFDRFLMADESSGSGLSAHLCYLFHKLLTGKSEPCFLTILSSESQTDFGDEFKPDFQFGTMTQTNNLPEDNPDMFAARYEGGRRIPYQTTPPSEKNAQFLALEQWAQSVLDQNREVAAQILDVTQKRLRTQQPLDAIAVALFLYGRTQKSPPALIETTIELIGHNRLVAYLERVPCELPPLPDQVTSHLDKAIGEVLEHLSYRLHVEHLAFIDRLSTGLAYFINTQTQLLEAISNLTFGLDAIEKDPRMMTIAENFYTYLNELLRSPGVKLPIGH